MYQSKIVEKWVIGKTFSHQLSAPGTISQSSRLLKSSSPPGFWIRICIRIRIPIRIWIRIKSMRIQNPASHTWNFSWQAAIVTRNDPWLFLRMGVDEMSKFLRYSTRGLQVLTYVFAGEQTFQLLSSAFFESLSSPSLLCQCKALFANTMQMLPLKIWNVLGSIPSSSDTVESEVRQKKYQKQSPFTIPRGFTTTENAQKLQFSSRIYYRNAAATFSS